jgi:hypothetical protein
VNKEEGKKGKINVDSLMQYASHWSLRFSGSLLVLSFAVNNVSQLDDIADAYAKKIVLEAEASVTKCPAVPEINPVVLERIEHLEDMAHSPTSSTVGE